MESDNTNPHETITEKLSCSCCGETMGSITGPREGVVREAEHHRTSKTSCSRCQKQVLNDSTPTNEVLNHSTRKKRGKR